MIDDFAKEYLHSELRDVRGTMLWKLEGLSEYDVRRPLTYTGTNRHEGQADILREQLDGAGGQEAGGIALHG